MVSTLLHSAGGCRKNRFLLLQQIGDFAPGLLQKLTVEVGGDAALLAGDDLRDFRFDGARFLQLGGARRIFFRFSDLILQHQEVIHVFESVAQQRKAQRAINLSGFASGYIR